VYLAVAAWAAARESGVWEASLSGTPGDRRMGYALAVTFVAAAIIARFVLLPGSGSRALTITFYPAVILAALYGGRRPGLLAAGLASLAMDYFWMEPIGRFGIGDPEDWVLLAIFLASSALIAWITEAMQQARARAEASEAEMALRRSEENLYDELRAMSRLQELSGHLVQQGALEPLLQAILAAAADLTGTDKGNQIYDPKTETLRILVHQGLGRRLVEHFAEDGIDAAAAAKGERIIVHDVEKLDSFREDGIRSIQSTPLLSRDGRLLGMLNNHYPAPGGPPSHALRYIDLLARQAASGRRSRSAGPPRTTRATPSA
jgi:hypothetical protein